MGAGLADEQSLTLSFQNNGFRPERSRITVVRLVPRLLIVQSPPSEKVELGRSRKANDDVGAFDQGGLQGGTLEPDPELNPVLFELKVHLRHDKSCATSQCISPQLPWPVLLLAAGSR